VSFAGPTTPSVVTTPGVVVLAAGAGGLVEAFAPGNDAPSTATPEMPSNTSAGAGTSISVPDNAITYSTPPPITNVHSVIWNCERLA
jgi:hypothetical protein